MRAEVATDGRGAVRLRAAAGTDETFLRRLYADRRAPELAPLGWTADQVAAFVDHQFHAQQAGYGSTFPAADHWIVLAGDEQVGRLLVDRSTHEHRIVDLVLLGEWRGGGIGTALIREVLGDARVAGLPVRLTVAVNEPHLVRWYARLGFSVVGRDDVHIRMGWSPSTPAEREE